MPRLVTAFSNTTVKRLRSLRDKKARHEEGLFLAEGLRILAEARDMGRLPAGLERVNLPGGVTVARMALNHLVKVRILAGQLGYY